MIRTGAIATVVAAACVLSACTSGGSTSTPSSTSSSSSAPSSTSAAPVVQPTNLPSSVANTVALRKSVELTSCTSTADGWQAAGTASNTRTSDFTYAITVYFTNATATVVGFAKKSVPVKAGQSAKWTAAEKFTAPKDTKCVLVGVAKG